MISPAIAIARDGESPARVKSMCVDGELYWGEANPDGFPPIGSDALNLFVEQFKKPEPMCDNFML